MKKTLLTFFETVFVFLLIMLATDVMALTKSPRLENSSPVSLLYRNTDIDPSPAATNMNIRPDFRLINHTDAPIAYSSMKVRYWFTVDQRASIRVETIFAKFGKENVTLRGVGLGAPHENANYYVEFGFTSAAGVLEARDTTDAFIRTKIRKADYTPFNELNDYSYSVPQVTFANEKMTVYLDDDLVWGTEPSEVPVVEDLKVVYSWGSATATTQIPFALRFVNAGNTAVPISELTVRYWFSENDALPLQYIEHYIGHDNVTTTGNIISLDPARDSASHYLEIAFDAPGLVVQPFSELKNFKFKIIRQGWKNFTSKEDDYSYIPSANEFNYQLNDHITLYRNGELVWGVEPPVGEGVSLNNVDNDALKLYPVPAHGTVALVLPASSRDYGQFNVYNHMGKGESVSYMIENGKVVFDISSLQPGIYFISAAIDRKIYKKRLSVN
ncbi:cellulose binding domain-containing protein [Pseudochryseolinea flava]|nr:cellulose binding domain-containing protein [Pseudochryseolinea flava]